MNRTQRGFTLIELLTVITITGIVIAMAVPRLRVSPQGKTRAAAAQLMQDLELSRTRALAAKKAVRMVFDVSSGAYTGYLDHDRDDTFNESPAETQALNGFGSVELASDVKYGRGSASPVPGDLGSGAVTFTDSRVEFDTRGITQPFGTRGTVYFVHTKDANAVSAVSVSGSASFKVWVYQEGTWK